MQAPQGAGKSARQPGPIGKIRTTTSSFPSPYAHQPALFRFPREKASARRARRRRASPRDSRSPRPRRPREVNPRGFARSILEPRDGSPVRVATIASHVDPPALGEARRIRHPRLPDWNVRAPSSRLTSPSLPRSVRQSSRTTPRRLIRAT